MKYLVIALLTLGLAGCQFPHRAHKETVADVSIAEKVLEGRVTALEQRLDKAKAARAKVAGVSVVVPVAPPRHLFFK